MSRRPRPQSKTERSQRPTTMTLKRIYLVLSRSVMRAARKALWIEERELDVGGVTSHRVGLTVILNAAFAVFALESVAEHLTIVRPIGNRLPERGKQVTGT